MSNSSHADSEIYQSKGKYSLKIFFIKLSIYEIDRTEGKNIKLRENIRWNTFKILIELSILKLSRFGIFILEFKVPN